MYSHLWPVQLYNIFPHYLINRNIFQKKATEHNMCVLISMQLLSETFLILQRIQQDIIINVPTLSRKVSVILVIF